MGFSSTCITRLFGLTSALPECYIYMYITFVDSSHDFFSSFSFTNPFSTGACFSFSFALNYILWELSFYIHFDSYTLLVSSYPCST